MIDYDRLRDQWRRAYSPISSRELETWSKDLKEELRTIPYMKLVKETTGGFINMLELKAVLNLEGLNLSMVRADLERIWCNGVASDMTVAYTFRETESGLKFFFGALNKSHNFVVGVLTVIRKEAL
jgi:hypothetical protein